jgi:hypothetical protein
MFDVKVDSFGNSLLIGEYGLTDQNYAYGQDIRDTLVSKKSGLWF